MAPEQSVHLCGCFRAEAERFLVEHPYAASRVEIGPDRCLGPRCSAKAFPGGCFAPIAPSWLIENLIGEGSYIVSPGWLEEWESHVGEWGFDKGTLRVFAAESMEAICLLDTRVHSDSEKKLGQMATALGVPATRIPIGMDHFTLRLERLLQDMDESGEPAAETTSHLKKLPVSDYAMALDLLSLLNSFKSEAEVIRELLSIYTSLFAPGDLSIIRFSEGKPAGVNCPDCQESPPGAGTREISEAFHGSSILSEYRDGFLFPLDFGTERLALVLMGDFAFPESKNAYRNLVESVMPVCALSLNNSRTMEALHRDKTLLEDQRSRLLETVELKNRLFTIIGHDLRGPIGGIRSALEFLVDEDKSNSILLKESLKASNEIFLLLVNLLEWGKSQQSIMELKPESLCVKDITEDIFALLERQAAFKGIKLVHSIDPEFRIRADGNTLGTVIRNLLSNALKFTPKGGEVRVHAEREGTLGRIVVSDTGIGMNGKTLKQVSDSGITAPKRGTDGERGSGLGLALCHDFVKKNGGTMRIASSPGKGTLVILEF